MGTGVYWDFLHGQRHWRLAVLQFHSTFLTLELAGAIFAPPYLVSTSSFTQPPLSLVAMLKSPSWSHSCQWAFPAQTLSHCPVAQWQLAGSPWPQVPLQPCRSGKHIQPTEVTSCEHLALVTSGNCISGPHRSKTIRKTVFFRLPPQSMAQTD